MVNQGVLARTELNNTSVTGPQGVLARVELDSIVAGGPQGALAAVTLNSSLLAGPQGVLARVDLRVPGSVNAGPDQTNVEPYTTIQLTGTDTAGPTDPRVWVQVSGPTAPDFVQTGKTATATAPGSTIDRAVVFGYSAAEAPQDTVSIQVLAATERVIRGGTQVPAKLMTVKL